MVNATVRDAFTAFYEEWLAKTQTLLEKLQTLLVSNNFINKDEECRDLAAQFYAHYQHFYDEKLKAADEDVFLVFSPPWLSSFERALLWLSGFKPSTLFRLLNSPIMEELSAEQREELEGLKTKTRISEKELEKTMATIQESVAAPRLVSLILRMDRLVDGETSDLENDMNELKESMMVVMKYADGLRGSTVKRVMEILDPIQTIKFFVAAARLQIEIRRWGLLRDSRA